MEDNINHPSHYTSYKGVEIIDLTEQMNFNRGNAVKYIARAGLKDPSKEIEDLQKAAWYVNREIERLKAISHAYTLENSGVIWCHKCVKDRCQGTREKFVESTECICCISGHVR